MTATDRKVLRKAWPFEVGMQRRNNWSQWRILVGRKGAGFEYPGGGKNRRPRSLRLAEAIERLLNEAARPAKKRKR